MNNVDDTFITTEKSDSGPSETVENVLPLKTIKEAFEPHYKEIQRRRTAPTDEQKYFEKVENGTEIPFKMDSQKVVLYSISSKEIPPCSTNELSPGLRVYGCFASNEDALEHASDLSRLAPTCSLFLHSTHDWIVIGKTIENMGNQEFINKTLEKNLGDYAKERYQNNKEFESAVTFEEDVERTVKNEKDEIPILYNKKSKSHNLKNGGEVRNQKYAIISFIPDTVNGTPIFTVYGCMETKEECEMWIKNTLSREITDFDLHVVSTCEWLFLNKMTNDNTQIFYRTPELNNIMNKQKSSKREVQDFEDTKK
tara:strand:+ start:204 stop:1136 length:933 start_codon:yes stop_codon:yes gene_type:complete